MTAAVTLAAYNEANTIRPIIREILDLGCECIVVDDGSRDATARIAEDAGARLVRHPINLGQGYALLTGLKVALQQTDCDIIIEMDADGQHRPSEIPLFIECMRSSQVDIVVGSRILGAHGVGTSPLRRLMLPYVTWGVNRLSGYELTDAMCGFRAFRRSALLSVLPMLDAMLEPQYLAAEMFIRFGRAGLRVAEVPVHVDQRSYSVSTKGMVRYAMGIMKATIRTMIEAKAKA